MSREVEGERPGSDIPTDTTPSSQCGTAAADYIQRTTTAATPLNTLLSPPATHYSIPPPGGGGKWLMRAAQRGVDRGGRGDHHASPLLSIPALSLEGVRPPHPTSAPSIPSIGPRRYKVFSLPYPPTAPRLLNADRSGSRRGVSAQWVSAAVGGSSAVTPFYIPRMLL